MIQGVNQVVLEVEDQDRALEFWSKSVSSSERIMRTTYAPCRAGGPDVHGGESQVRSRRTSLPAVAAT
jgi:hypothetical protein